MSLLFFAWHWRRRYWHQRLYVIKNFIFVHHPAWPMQLTYYMASDSMDGVESLTLLFFVQYIECVSHCPICILEEAWVLKFHEAIFIVVPFGNFCLLNGFRWRIVYFLNFIFLIRWSQRRGPWNCVWSKTISNGGWTHRFRLILIKWECYPAFSNSFWYLCLVLFYSTSRPVLDQVLRTLSRHCWHHILESFLHWIIWPV